MNILRSRSTTAVVLAVTAFLLAWLVPGQAGAASDYPSGNASDFATSNGGWTGDAEYGGLCVPAVTCPQLSGSYQSSGGASGSGDGYIRTDSGALTVVSLLSTSTYTWTSPAFTYNGAGGEEPDELSFSVGIDPGVTELLNLGATVNVSARAIAVSGGGDQTLIDAVSPGTTTGWKTLTGQAGPGALEVGKQYRIELSVSIGGLAAVLPAGSIGFDDVLLKATSDDSGGNGGNGGNSGNGGNGNGNGAALPPPKVIPPGVAYLYRNKLFVRVKCPRRFKPRCRVNFFALTKKRHGKRLTAVRRANVRHGRAVRKVLGVRKPFRAKVRRMAKAKKRVLVRQRIWTIRGPRSKRKHTVRYQRLRVVIRTRK
jgi:hypothetical protein